MQNSPFSSLAVAVAIANTHCAYPRMDGHVELTWVAGYILSVRFWGGGSSKSRRNFFLSFFWYLLLPEEGEISSGANKEKAIRREPYLFVNIFHGR